MSIIVQSGSGSFESGSHYVVVDQIIFADNPFKPGKQQLEIVLSLAEDSSQTTRFYTAPVLHPKGKLLPFCQALLRRPLTEAELRKGFDIEELLGKDLLVTVEPAVSKEGMEYSKVVGFLPVKAVTTEADLTLKKEDMPY